MEKNTLQLSFSSISVQSRRTKSEFFDQINELLDWKLIEKEIRKHYTKGISVSGRRSYSGLLLFKISLTRCAFRKRKKNKLFNQLNIRIFI